MASSPSPVVRCFLPCYSSSSGPPASLGNQNAHTGVSQESQEFHTGTCPEAVLSWVARCLGEYGQVPGMVFTFEGVSLHPKHMWKDGEI